MAKSIHLFLKSVRLEQQLSIQELAKASGVSASHISRIERSERNPSPQTLEKLAPYLNVSYMQLLEIANLVDPGRPETIYMEQILQHPHVTFEGHVISEEMKDKIRSILESLKKD